MSSDTCSDFYCNKGRASLQVSGVTQTPLIANQLCVAL